MNPCNRLPIELDKMVYQQMYSFHIWTICPGGGGFIAIPNKQLQGGKRGREGEFGCLDSRPLCLR